MTRRPKAPPIPIPCRSSTTSTARSATCGILGVDDVAAHADERAVALIDGGQGLVADMVDSVKKVSSRGLRLGFGDR